MQYCHCAALAALYIDSIHSLHLIPRFQIHELKCFLVKLLCKSFITVTKQIVPGLSKRRTEVPACRHCHCGRTQQTHHSAL
jgi:hypothetical protein